MAGFYFFLALLSLACTAMALVQARRLYWLIPPYFMLAWLCGELAVIHIRWQVVLTGVLALFGFLDQPLAQAGLALFALSWVGLLYLHSQSMDAPQHLAPALTEALGDGFIQQIPAERLAVLQPHRNTRDWLHPFTFERAGVRKQTNIAYGEAGERNLLDLYLPETPLEGGSPVLLQVHGGGWVIGQKEQQGKPLMYQMAQRGWICVAINYRLSPKVAFPEHIIDVKRAIAWLRDHIADHGGNPEFIAITGGSAGGHLSSLAALTPNKAEWQPGFESVDTRLQAAVPFYGVYDFLDRANIRPEMSLDRLLAERVIQCTAEEQPELWDSGSPIAQVRADAPPMFVIHGTHDTLVWVEEAREFVAALRAVSEAPVAYAELPGAQHAFEVFHSVRTGHTMNAVCQFLEWAYADWRVGRA